MGLATGVLAAVNMGLRSAAEAMRVGHRGFRQPLVGPHRSLGAQLRPLAG